MASYIGGNLSTQGEPHPCCKPLVHTISYNGVSSTPYHCQESKYNGNRPVNKCLGGNIRLLFPYILFNTVEY